jgi:rubredoxin
MLDALFLTVLRPPTSQVCADCGYVYDRDIDGGGLAFEEMKKGFICPQCSAPRRRYAKKVGDQWGVTNDGGDLPIYAFTFLGLAATAWFSLVYVPTL